MECGESKEILFAGDGDELGSVSRLVGREGRDKDWGESGADKARGVGKLVGRRGEIFRNNGRSERGATRVIVDDTDSGRIAGLA